MTRRHFVLAAALAVAAWLALFGDKTSQAEIAEPVARATVPARLPATTGVRQTKTEHAPAILALKDRERLIGGAQAEKAAEGLFNDHSWMPPPPPPPKLAPPQAPQAPPLPFTYLGKKAEDGTWEVYLARGEQTFIARAEAVIEGTYRVEPIQPPMLVLTYLPLNQKQTLTIGGTD